jgi:hypothetical protein
MENIMHISSFYKKESKYLRTDDVPGELTATIAGVEAAEFDGEGGKKETKPVLVFRDHKQRLVLNRTNLAAMSVMYGDETGDWVGKKIRLHIAKTKFKNQMMNTIRVGRVEKESADNVGDTF